MVGSVRPTWSSSLSSLSSIYTYTYHIHWYLYLFYFIFLYIALQSVFIFYFIEKYKVCVSVKCGLVFERIRIYTIYKLHSCYIYINCVPQICSIRLHWHFLPLRSFSSAQHHPFSLSLSLRLMPLLSFIIYDFPSLNNKYSDILFHSALIQYIIA